MLVEGLLCGWHCSRHWDTVGNKRKITVYELPFYYCTAELKTFAKGINNHGSLNVARNRVTASADMEPPKLRGVFIFGQKWDDFRWRMTWHQRALDHTRYSEKQFPFHDFKENISGWYECDSKTSRNLLAVLPSPSPTFSFPRDWASGISLWELTRSKETVLDNELDSGSLLIGGQYRVSVSSNSVVLKVWNPGQHLGLVEKMEIQPWLVWLSWLEHYSVNRRAEGLRVRFWAGDIARF